ncbi:hypothetical protein OUZ56_010743 [Daphnia magna]|uniref:Uncharacterized protein n=1 Tax=Daphnia magna TaxID=35525 RepID=A0ABQ9YYH4_9CRUS|nr:hypothetical protein OUZ56_010743 [Daphnia magna]
MSGRPKSQKKRVISLMTADDEIDRNGTTHGHLLYESTTKIPTETRIPGSGPETGAVWDFSVCFPDKRDNWLPHFGCGPPNPANRQKTWPAVHFLSLRSGHRGRHPSLRVLGLLVPPVWTPTEQRRRLPPSHFELAKTA